MIAPAPAELCIILAVLLLTTPAAVVMIIGALKMKRLDSYSWATAAAVVAVLPVTPLFPLSLAVGIWALFVLNRPEVKRAFGRGPDTGRPARMPERDEAWHAPRRTPGRSIEERPADHSAAEVGVVAPPRSGRPSDVSAAAPRFSRKAIVGAAWAPFFFLAAAAVGMLALSLHGTAPPEDSHVQRRMSAEFGLILFVLLVPGITAPFGTTILGVLAVSDIRHSRGRLVGLPMALADALLFPLLALNAVLYALATVVVIGFLQEAMPLAAAVVLFAAMIALVLFVNFRIIRGAYRAALPEAGPSAAAPELAGVTLSEPPESPDPADRPQPSMTTLFSRAWNRLWGH